MMFTAQTAALLSQALDEGHKGVIVTAGTSATGFIAASLARRRNIPAIFLVRSPEARDVLLRTVSSTSL